MKMKKIGLVLASIIFLLGGKVQAQEMPFGFGIKAGYMVGSLYNLSDAQGPWKSESQGDLNILAPKILAGLFAEYAFHDYVGAGLEARYAMTGASFSKKAVNGENSEAVTLRMHTINALPLLKVYPMGRDIDATIWNINLGPEFSMPIQASYKQGKEAKNHTIDKKNLNPLNIAIAGGLGFEFPFGLLLDANFSYGFKSAFKQVTTATTATATTAAATVVTAQTTDTTTTTTATTAAEKDFMKEVLNPKNENTKFNPWYASLSIGYNFARLID
jgi:outer membrane protein W